MTTTTRNLRVWSQVHLCHAGLVHKGEGEVHDQSALATHGVTDSREVTVGVFEETAMRFGCAEHPVASMVYYLNGDMKPFSEVLSCQ